MNVLYYLLRKEFAQIFRDKSIIKMIIAMPIIQLLIIPNAANYEVNNIELSVVDNDNTVLSRSIIEKIVSSGYFIRKKDCANYKEALESIDDSSSEFILEIPYDFEKKFYKSNTAKLFISSNAINGVKANIGTGYMLQIIKNFNKEIIVESKNTVTVIPKYKFNPYLRYDIFMSTGVLAILITIIGSSMTSLNIVKEKELGTIEQINVTPIKKHIFILGKLLPFLTIGLVIFTVGLIIIHNLYDVIIQGSLFVLYSYTILYLIAILGLGLFISTLCETQQQSMMYSFFLMLIFILLGGLYTSIESMPQWAQKITYLNPSRYFIEIMRMIVIKGSSFKEVRLNFIVTFLFAILFNSLAIFNYKKQI